MVFVLQPFFVFHCRENEYEYVDRFSVQHGKLNQFIHEKECVCFFFYEFVARNNEFSNDDVFFFLFLICRSQQFGIEK